MGDQGQRGEWLARHNGNGSRVPCHACHLRTRCAVAAFPADDLESLKGHVRALRPVRRGDTFYRAGEAASRLLIVHAGSARISLSRQGGREMICDYYLPGDTLGLEALHTGTHTATCVALETTQVCELSRNSLMRLAGRHPDLRERICLQMNRALVRSQHHQLDIATKSSEQRLAGFLIDVSMRLGERGYSTHSYRLPLTRLEIANHLGMRTETLSRLLADFRRRGLITLAGREIDLLQREGLSRLAGD
ncbi:cyclic nucleotide-binding domain-containing protein [Acidihalobacter prosperus]|uniref:cyclic nucleotide-binding domain-containing protein n=1 Tax=Acidihalobacter prosperus TaxID=160660 RepID=UPI00056FE29A|nr:helix-turn-helix domain-containing protein [Acidihalobacter prosperus]